ncbi:MAG: efflux RND transporter permease subunit [Deltaproteobacteria bacterium]|nr:efflux RND transporter permease subunit [Deltaproteobacteria bacterium]
MRISGHSIERPVLATVLSLVIVLAGVIALPRLSNRELPDVDPPIVSVSTIYTGAAPEVVETSVTQPLEDELVGIDGIRHLTSLSREQVSEISIEFDLGRNVDDAANDVRDRVARVRGTLPEEVEDPVVAKSDADAAPIIWMALASERYGQLELSTIAETRLKDRLSKLPGVATIIIAGERRHAMRVWIDNVRLTAANLTIAEVEQALARENVDLPSGRIEGARREFTVRTLGEVASAEEFGALVITERAGEPIRLGDVARVEVGPEDDRNFVRFNGKPSVALGVVRQSKANTVAVADAVLAEVEALRRELPADVMLDVAYDQSTFIRRSVADVTRTIFEAILLVVAVIYLFLRSLRATLVPAVAIPVSVIGTFAFLDLFGFSINTLTLMGLTLAIGLVVDDAIVVLENVTRWVESGTPPREAAHRGMQEISFAVLATTVSVIAVFLPLAFLTDQTGRLFREFGVTVAAAVAISGFVALTLAPMMCARLVRPARAEHGVKLRLERALQHLTAGYRRLLGVALDRRRVCLAVGAAWFTLGLWLLYVLPREFVPHADRGNILVITEAPEGTTLLETDRYQREVEAIVQSAPNVAKAFSVVAFANAGPGAVNRGGMFVTLDPWEARALSQEAVIGTLYPRLHRVAGMLAFPLSPPSLGTSFDATPISLVLQGPDVQQLAVFANEITRRAGEIPGVVNVRSDLVLNKPQVVVDIDRNRAADLGVSVRTIASTLQILLGGLDLSRFKLEGETYKVMVQLQEAFRRRPSELLELYVRGKNGELVPLQSVVRVRESTAPRGLPHFDRLRSATLSASLLPGVPLGASLDRIRALATEVTGDAAGYRLTFSGESEDFYESGNALAFAYLLAIVIIYLVLAAQFESVWHPAVLMIAVALSFTGALATLWLTGATLNLFSQIGLVMLIGLVTKNSILIVEFANQLREQGRDLATATFEASVTRFRPILMTAISTVVGILPIAIGSGAGGELRAPLGIAVAGGVVFSTALTVFVVPAAYLVLENTMARVRASRPGTAWGRHGGRG